MEPQQHPQQDKSSSSNSKGNFLCRQSSSRWTPTTDQIRILKDLYYNNGIRSPSAEQIQKISVRLRQYGKIEGKNVFYWFQNHKARERQKKRFTVDMAMQRGAVEGCGWKPKDFSQNKFTNISPGLCSSSSSSSPSALGVGQMGTVGYGSFVMEKSFGDFSITGRGGDGVSGSVSNNLAGWVGMDPCSATYTLYNNRRSRSFIEEDELDEEGGHHGPGNAMETLPLFPMHGEDISGICSANSNSGDWHYYTNNGGCSRTSSLELTLKSYTPRSPDSS